MISTPVNREIEDRTRLIMFRGSRVDALERLPTVCPNERLELGNNRISLVSDRKRVDLHILAEIELAEIESALSHDAVPMMLLELHFDPASMHQADEFVQCLQRQQDFQLH